MHDVTLPLVGRPILFVTVAYVMLIAPAESVALLDDSALVLIELHGLHCFQRSPG